ncbi:CAP domain-containing protein [uncultured Flavobacterium sp.]|uniref:CAP domain-containing protein n=1 Tax=uncultured Flavobacterium sp. TaxID=165435 RepID=UPI0030EC581B
MKLKSLFALLLVLVICTMNSCSADPYETLTKSDASTALEKKAVKENPTTDLYNYSYTSSEIQLMDLVNAYRVSIGLSSLTKSNYVSLKAEEHNNYMISTNTLSHDNFNARFDDIMKTVGAIAVGENVADVYSTPQAALNAWLNSPAHKKNIIGSFTHFGISIRENSVTGKKYYTNIFAKI